MAVTGHVFPTFIEGAMAGAFSTGQTFSVALGNNATSVDLTTAGITAAKTFSDWTAIVNEIPGGNGYTSGGTSVGTLSWTTTTADPASGPTATLALNASSNPTWTGATFSANQAVLYQSTGGGSYQLVAFWDFGGSISVSSGTFTLTINPSGLLTATVN